MRWFPLALILGASFALAQILPPQALPPPPPPPPVPTSQPSVGAPSTGTNGEKPARVEGTILSLNGEVVRKATVRLQGGATQPGQQPGAYSETTDNGGRFVFEDIAPGRYLLSAEKAGFINARYGARSNSSSGTQLTLSAGTEMKGLSIKMTPQGVIAGKVVDRDGDPVPSSQVQAMRNVYIRGRKQLQPAGGASTNDLGEYRISNLAPGRYYLSANSRAFSPFAQERPGRPGTVPEANVLTYYPNAADAASSVPVEVVAGGEMRGIDIRLVQARVYAVSGKAVVASGATPQAILSLTRKEDPGILPAVLNGGGTTQLRPDGSFEFRNITAGAYVLQFMQGIGVNGSQPPALTGRVDVTVSDANIAGLVLPLGPGPEISGTVSLEGGDIATLLKPAPGASGGAIAGNPAILQPGRLGIVLTGYEGGPGGTANAQIKEDGTFRFNSVGANKYAPNVFGLPQGTYLKSARFGGQDVTRALIDTTSGTGGTLDLVISQKAADAAGSVQNDKGEPQGGVMVTMWPKIPDVSPSGGARISLTDQNGGFKFQGLAPGDYYIAAWEELDPGLAQSADFLNRFSSEAGTVKLAESGHETRDIKIMPADKVQAEIDKLP